MEPTPATPQARRPIGQVLVERGLVSQDELRAALVQQQSTGGKLGEILVERGAITRLALASALSEQWDDASRHLHAVETAPAATAAPEPVTEDRVRRPLGELLREQDLVDDEQLAAALAEQAERGGKLGEILVERGAITRLALASALSEQWEAEARAAEPAAAPVAAVAVHPTAGTLGELRDDLRAIREGLEELRQPEPLDPEALAAEVAARVGLRDQGIQERLDGLTERLAAADPAREEALGVLRELAARPAPAAPDLSGLERRADDLDGALAELSSRLAEARPPDLDGFEERLVERVDALGSSVRDQLVSASGLDRERLARLADELAALRREVTQPDRRLDDVLTAVRELGDRDPAGGLLAWLDEVRRGVAEELSGATAPLRERLDAIAAAPTPELDLSPLETRVSELAEQLRAHGERETPPVDLSQLEARLAELAEFVRSDRPGLDLSPVADRLAALDERLQALVDRSDATERLDALAGTLERLEGGIAGASGPAVDLGPVEQRLAELAHAVSSLPEPERVEPVGPRLAELERLLGELAGSPTPAVDLSPLQVQLAELGEQVRSLAGREEHEPDLQPLHSRLDRLAERMEALGGSHVDLSPLEDGLVGLRELVQASAPGPENAARLAELASVLERLEGRMAAAPDHAIDLTGVEARLADLAEAVSSLPESNPTEQLGPRLAELERLLGELAHTSTEAVDLAPVAARLDGLGAAVDGTAAELGALRARLESTTDGVDLGSLHERLGRLDERLAALGGGDGVERIVARLDELAGRLDALAGREIPAPVDFAPLVDRLDALAAAATSDAEPSAHVADDLVRRIAELRAEVDFGPLEERLDGLAAALSHAGRDDGVVGERLAALGEQVARLADRPDAGLNERLDGVAHALAELSAREDGAVAERLGRLEEQLARLADRPQDDLAGRLDGLAHELARLAARGDDGITGRLDELGGRIGHELEALRHALAEQSPEAALAGQLDELQRSLDETQRERAGELAGRLDALEQRLSADAEPAWAGDLRRRADDTTERLTGLLVGQLASLRERLEGHGRGDEDDLRRELERLRADLGGRLDELASPAVDPEELAARDRRIAELDETVAGLERSLAERRAPEHALHETGRFVALAPTPAGYRLLERDGAPPSVGDVVDVPDGAGLVVVKLGRSPFPGDRRRCAYLEPA